MEDDICFRKNVVLNTKRRFNKSERPVPSNQHIVTQPPVSYQNEDSDSSSSSDSKSSNNSDTESSDEFDLTTVTGNRNSTNNINHNRKHSLNSNLPIIFELSEDNMSQCSKLSSSMSKIEHSDLSKDRKSKFPNQPIASEKLIEKNNLLKINVDSNYVDENDSLTAMQLSIGSDKNTLQINKTQTDLDECNKADVCISTQKSNTTNRKPIESTTHNKISNNHLEKNHQPILEFTTRKTPRFVTNKMAGYYQKNNTNNNNNNNNNKPDVITDLDDEPVPSLLKNKMYKNYSKNQLKPKDADLRSSSHEISGNIVKMDKTINHVTNDIVRIDNVIERLSNFNRNFLASLEQMSDAELSSIVSLHSNAAQTDPVALPKTIRESPISPESSSSGSESSTEQESSTDDQSEVKPSPVHQILQKKPPSISSTSTTNSTNPRTVASIKLQNQQLPTTSLNYHDSDLSSLPESSVCEEPEKRKLPDQVQYFQRQIKKQAGLYKKPELIEPPKRLSVEDLRKKHPHPKPRVNNRIISTSSSSESSSNFDYQTRTLSNRNQQHHADYLSSNDEDEINSRNGSILSLGINNNGSKVGSNNNNGKLGTTGNGADNRLFQKGSSGTLSGRFNKNTKMTTTGLPMKAKGDDEVASLSGKPLLHGANHKSPVAVRSHLPHSRSYNSLHPPTQQQSQQSGLQTRPRSKMYNSQSHLENGVSSQEFLDLCELIRQHLTLANHEQIKSIFRALMLDNNRDKIEEIIDYFLDDNDRDILLQLAAEIGHGLNKAESIFDMRMSRTDLYNQLRPGLSLSSLHTPLVSGTGGLGPDRYGTLGGLTTASTMIERMVLWRADLEELIPPPLRPPSKPSPTNLLKSAIVSPEVIAHVDSRVEQVLQFDPTTFTELVSFLTKDCSNDVERVRALFRWITMYDMKYLSFDPAAPNDSLIGMLRAIKSGQMTYNELFYHLCRYAAIQCQFISGYSKGAGYRPGMLIKDNRMFRNVWTAVFVAGAWRFVNCNWGARYLTSSTSSAHHLPLSASGLVGGTLTRSVAHLAPFSTLSLNNATSLTNPSLRYRCDEFYFLTDAKQHIFEHLPDKKQWQLLNRPISLEQFMLLPIVKSPFFNANLSFKRNYAETLQTKNGKVTIKINMPRAVGVSCKLENSADNTELRGLTLIQIVDLQTIVVTAAPSQPGKFYLSIYVTNPNDDWRTTSDAANGNSASASSSMEMACSFQVHCSEHNYDRLVTGRYPDVGMLGATPAAVNLGTSINAGVAPFVIWDDKSTMKINVTIRPGLRLGHRMTSYDRSGINSAPCDSYALLQRQISGSTGLTGGQHQYHIRFPVDAFYCLSIFASSGNIGVNNGSEYSDTTSRSIGKALNNNDLGLSQNDADDDDDPQQLMQCVYRLLIDCRKATDRIPPFPRQTSRWINCRLLQPLEQHLMLSTRYRFAIDAPDCSAMAVIINDDPINRWHDLTASSSKNSVLWKSKIDTGEELDRLSVYGRFYSKKASKHRLDDDQNSNEEFIKLLDYVLIPKTTK